MTRLTTILASLAYIILTLYMLYVIAVSFLFGHYILMTLFIGMVGLTSYIFFDVFVKE